MKRLLLVFFLIFSGVNLYGAGFQSVVPAAGGGDNLGTHVATQVINAADFAVVNASAVGINTANPSSRLEVNAGSITVRGSGAGIAIGTFPVITAHDTWTNGTNLGRTTSTIYGANLTVTKASDTVTVVGSASSSSPRPYALVAGSAPFGYTVDIASRSDYAWRTAITSMVNAGITGTIGIPSNFYPAHSLTEIPPGINLHFEEPGSTIAIYSNFNVMSVSGSITGRVWFHPVNSWSKDFILMVNGSATVTGAGMWNGSTNQGLNLSNGNGIVSLSGHGAKLKNYTSKGTTYAGTDAQKAAISTKYCNQCVISGVDLEATTNDMTVFKNYESTGTIFEDFNISGHQLSYTIDNRGATMGGNNAASKQLTIRRGKFRENAGGGAQVMMLDFCIQCRYQDIDFINAGSVSGNAMDFQAGGPSTSTVATNLYFENYTVGAYVRAEGKNFYMHGNRCFGDGCTAVSDLGGNTKLRDNNSNGAMQADSN